MCSKPTRPCAAGRQNAASYLALDLQLDWRAGADYFESVLLDYDPCSNWGNWVSHPRVTVDGNKDYLALLTTERLFWHRVAHTAEPKIGLIKADSAGFFLPKIAVFGGTWTAVSVLASTCLGSRYGHPRRGRSPWWRLQNIAMHCGIHSTFKTHDARPVAKRY